MRMMQKIEHSVDVNLKLSVFVPDDCTDPEFYIENLLDQMTQKMGDDVTTYEINFRAQSYPEIVAEIQNKSMTF